MKRLLATVLFAFAFAPAANAVVIPYADAGTPDAGLILLGGSGEFHFLVPANTISFGIELLPTLSSEAYEIVDSLNTYTLPATSTPIFVGISETAPITDVVFVDTLTGGLTAPNPVIENLVDAQLVPEPSSAALLGLPLIALMATAIRRRRDCRKVGGYAA
jgi:hypothetical protein